MMLRLLILHLRLDEAVMKLIELFKTALHATAFVLVVVKASSIVMRKVEARDAQLHLSVACRPHHVCTIHHGFSVFDSDVLEVCVLHRDMPHLLSCSIGVELLHGERETSNHFYVFPSKSLMMPARIPSSEYSIRCLNNFVPSGSLNKFR